MSLNRKGLGDLPGDLGTDHGQRLLNPGDQQGVGPGPGKQAGGAVPGWAKWLAGVLIPNMFGPVVFSTRPFVVGIDSIELSSGKKRTYLLIQNNSVSDMWVSFGVDSAPGQALKIAAGGYYEPIRVPSNSIFLSAASGASAGILIEGQ